MANSQDVIAGTSPSNGIDMSTMSRSVYASPAAGVTPSAVSGVPEAQIAQPAAVIGTGDNPDLTTPTEDS